MRRHSTWLLLLASTACTTALSTTQTADTLPKGHWRLTAGANFAIPASRIVSLVDKADDISKAYANDPNYTPTQQQQNDLEDAGLGLALNAPGPTPDLMLRYGLSDRFDAGARYTTTGVHGDVKVQFLRDAGGWDGSLSLGYARHIFDGLAFDLLDKLHVDDFSRWDLEVPIIFGRKFGTWGRLWLGPKYDFGRYHIDAKIVNVAKTRTADGPIHYVGGFVGFSAGYKWLHAFVELTVMDMIATPTIQDRKVDIGGIVVVPAFGLSADF